MTHFDSIIYYFIYYFTQGEYLAAYVLNMSICLHPIKLLVENCTLGLWFDSNALACDEFSSDEISAYEVKLRFFNSFCFSIWPQLNVSVIVLSFHSVFFYLTFSIICSARLSAFVLWQFSFS